MAAPAWVRHFHECIRQTGRRARARQSFKIFIRKWKSYLELTQIRFFLTLCSTLNFERAAGRCDVALSLFSRAIEKLEVELGGPLVGHTGENVRLTALGLEVRPHLNILLQAADDATSPGRQESSVSGYRLSIGLAPGISAANVAVAAYEVARLFPGVSLNLNQAASPMLVSKLLAGRLDCALLDEACDTPDRISRWTLATGDAVLPRPEERLARPCIVLVAMVQHPVNMAARQFLRLCRSMDRSRFVGDAGPKA
jgi:DNA-binding transcriptional LysR family regulator